MSNAKFLSGKTITVRKQPGKPVTVKDLADEITRRFAIETSEKLISLNGDIQSAGAFSFQVRLGIKIYAQMKVIVSE